LLREGHQGIELVAYAARQRVGRRQWVPDAQQRGVGYPGRLRPVLARSRRQSWHIASRLCTVPTTNVYFDLTEELNRDGRIAVLGSGQAVVWHRLAIMSKDGDWILRESPEACARALRVLEQHGARYRLGARSTFVGSQEVGRATWSSRTSAAAAFAVTSSRGLRGCRARISQVCSRIAAAHRSCRSRCSSA
jgi:hypothetical protein